MIVAIDIGATKTVIAAERGRTLARLHTFPTPRDGKKLLEEIAARLGELGKVEKIGVGTVGPIDVKRGVVINPPNLCKCQIDLPSTLLEFADEVYVLNDTMAAVWGEYKMGKYAGTKNLVYITISTGIGAGVIVDGRLLLGKMGNAHEVGHIVLDVESEIECGCGGRGHWEAMASGSGLPRLARSMGVNAGSPEEIYELARKGDKGALEVIERANRIHVAGLVSVTNVYDPEVILLGGSVALKNRDLLFEPVVEQFEREKGVLTIRPRVDLATYGHNAVIYGAYALAKDPPEDLLSVKEY